MSAAECKAAMAAHAARIAAHYDAPLTARLISAAPELYEALREIFETVEGENVHFTGASAWLAKARAALEKAGGAE